MENNYRCPQTGRFLGGNTNARYGLTNHATMVRRAIAEMTTPELVQTEARKLLSEGGHVARSTLELLLHYTIGKPTEKIELTTTQGTIFNIELLSRDDQQALEAITLKALGQESVKFIDAQFEEAKVIDSETIQE